MTAKNNYIVAIDLGSSCVTVGAASKDPDGRLNILDIISKPMEGMERGEVTNIEQVTATAREALGELESNLGIKVREVYTGISGESIKCGTSSYYVYINGQDGEIREEDISKLHESMNTLPAPDGYCILDRIPQKYVIDSREETMKPVGRFGNRIESTFSFVLGSRNGVDRLTKALSRLQVGAKKVYSNAQASAEAVLNDDERELGAVVVDMGAQCTDICIWHENIMRYVGVIPIGSDAINNDIRSMAIREKVIEKLKVKHGYATPDAIPAEKSDQTIVIKGNTKRDDKGISYIALSQIIESRLLDIFEYITEEIKDSGYADKIGTGIVLTGGIAKLPGVDTLFREKTKYDVRISGADSARLNEESIHYSDDTSLASTIGLLLLGVEDSRLDSSASPIKKKQTNADIKEEDPIDEQPLVDYDDDEDDVDINSVPDKPKRPKKEEKTPKQPKEGWLRRAKKGFNKVFDLEVIDDNDDKI